MYKWGTKPAHIQSVQFIEFWHVWTNKSISLIKIKNISITSKVSLCFSESTPPPFHSQATTNLQSVIRNDFTFLYEWHSLVCTFLCLACSLSIITLKFIHVDLSINRLFVFTLNNIPLQSEVKWKSVLSDSLWPQGLYSPWNSPGQNTGVGSHSLPRESSQPRDQTQVSHTAGRFFTSWAIREAQSGLGMEGKTCGSQRSKIPLQG